MERDIHEEISGSHREFLLEILKANRSVNSASVVRTNKLIELLSRFESSGDEMLLERINVVFARESFEQLREAFSEYVVNKHGCIEGLFESLSSDHKNALETLGKCR